MVVVGSGVGPTGRLCKVHPAVGLVALGAEALQVPVRTPHRPIWRDAALHASLAAAASIALTWSCAWQRAC